MIRLTYLLRCKSEMSRVDFQKYWREIHGPLVAGHAHNLGVLRYVQVHTLEEGQIDPSAGPRGAMEQPYDGVEEFWWLRREDLLSALDSSRGEAALQELVEDEAKFIDLPNSPLWFAYEYPQVNPSPENIVATERSSLVKSYYPLKHLARLTLDEAQLYWRTVHGPFIRLLAASGQMKRYVQVHYYEDELEGAMRKARGTIAEPYTGHAESWRDRATAADTPEMAQFTKLAVEDERNFIDFKRSTRWLAKEWVFVDYR
ncbi:MAG: EthD domain-containing protein [Chloroflexi bacterium]|nr:EthD domain-containing protein [Chloroflexota bacterium]